MRRKETQDAGEITRQRKSTEFQAVILAGGINSSLLYPVLIENDRLPKSLLPVCNKPLLYYQLKLLEKAGFKEVLVATEEKYKKQFVDYLTTYREKEKGEIKVELFHATQPQQPPPGEGGDGGSSNKETELIIMAEDELGTAETLRQMSSKIQSDDFLILPGDLITEISLHTLADIHRSGDATLTMFLKEQDTSESGKVDLKSSTPFNSKADDLNPTFYGLDLGKSGETNSSRMNPHQARVVLVKSALERDDGAVSIKRILLEKFPNITIHTKVNDTHLYLFKRWVLDVIEEKKFSSIKNDLVPFLINLQHKHLETHNKAIFDLASSKFATAHHVSSGTCPKDSDRVKVLAHVSKSKAAGVFCVRATTCSIYGWLNFALLEYSVGTNTPWDAFTFASLESVTNMETGSSRSVLLKDNESVASFATTTTNRPSREYIKTLLGANCVISPTAQINRTIIGDGCVIGNNVKINNCVILSNCKIEDGCILQHSLLAGDVTVKKNCNLNKVRIASRFVVEEGTNIKEFTTLAFDEDDQHFNG